ncbi:ROK family protein [Thermogutta sp.]|uniref:ROK family protein n=1 Tax=Thermogutta sp. TaxID=1962930 RepID=UPI00321FD58F
MGTGLFLTYWHSMCYLGIEIGGTKLQVGIGTGDEPRLMALHRDEIDRRQGAEAIRRRILDFARPLIAEHHPRAIGIAFGGPIDVQTGRTLKSHHVAGWDNFPLIQWCQDELGLPAAMGNDADLAGWAEAIYGAGKGHRAVFYITVGTGIGGALIYEGKIYTGAHGIAAEIGHLRPGPTAVSPENDLESISAGWGIAARAQTLVREILASRGDFEAGSGDSIRISVWREKWATEELGDVSFSTLNDAAMNLLQRCGNDLDRLTTKMLGEALASGNVIAAWVFARALRTLGWAIAQMITLLAPSAIVIGGGVSLLGERLFFEPLRKEVARYVFPPLADRYVIRPAELGEEVMVHGAILLARQSFETAAGMDVTSHALEQKR